MGSDPVATNATMFRWHDPPSNEEILVLYHKAQRDSAFKIPLRSEFNTYGGFTSVDNTIVAPSGKVALASFIAADNTGPPITSSEVKGIFKTVRDVFPNAATVLGSTWDHFVAEISPAEVKSLPRYSSAWGKFSSEEEEAEEELTDSLFLRSRHCNPLRSPPRQATHGCRERLPTPADLRPTVPLRELGHRA